MAVRNATQIIAGGLLLVTLTGCATASLQQATGGVEQGR
jgi:hypothetical protein